MFWKSWWSSGEKPRPQAATSTALASLKAIQSKDNFYKAVQPPTCVFALSATDYSQVDVRGKFVQYDWSSQPDLFTTEASTNSHVSTDTEVSDASLDHSDDFQEHHSTSSTALEDSDWCSLASSSAASTLQQKRALAIVLSIAKNKNKVCTKLAKAYSESTYGFHLNDSNNALPAWGV